MKTELNEQKERIRIIFESNEVYRFNYIFTTFLREISVLEFMPDFELKRDEKKILIEVDVNLNNIDLISNIIVNLV